MKYFILILFLSSHILGFTQSLFNSANDKEITNERARTELFLTAFVEDNQLFLQIPSSIINKPMLFVRHEENDVDKHKQIVWSLSKENILLEVPRIQSSDGVIIPLKKNPTLHKNILAIFPIDKEKSSSKVYCINITNLILNQTIEWELEFSETLIPELSLIEGAKHLDNELIIKTQRGLFKNQSRVSVPVYFNFYALPQPMESRQFDYRMGFFNEEKNSISYGAKNSIANITRWRLEKKYKNKQISVPVKPITFILSPKIPKKWRPYVKSGIEEWLPAFESAGFKNALIIKEVDKLDDWNGHSVNNSIVRWGDYRDVRGFEDAGGSTVSNIVDLRSGEILKSDILIGSSYQQIADRYFIRCAPLDKRAHQYPFSDDLMGELIQFLVAHETGHAFGIMDNNYGEYSYPFDKMRDETWLKNMGHTPSVMTYARHNNVAQPEDNIPPSLLIQKVGPTDLYNIRWAYTSFSNVYSLDEKSAYLEGIIRLQDSIPWFRYNNNQYEIIGPGATNEVVETNDPIKSTQMALKNLKRVIELLPEVNKDQKDNARLERLYTKTINLWYHHMRHIVSLIGGYDIYYKSINQEGRIYTPIDIELQKAAIDFLISNAFSPPDWLIHSEFMSKLNYSTFPDKVVEYQQLLLFELLRPQRMKRLEYLENSIGIENATQRFLSKLQLGLFKELYESTGTVDPREQELQSTYIDKLITIVQQKRVNIEANKKDHDYTDYSKGLIMEQLKSLEKRINKKVTKNKDHISIGHWMLCLKKLNKKL